MSIQSLTEAELLALLAAARQASERDFLMLELGFRHGLRNSEVIALTRDNFADGFITVQRLKGSMKTTQPLGESENPLLNECAAVNEYLLKLVGDRLFPMCRHTFWRHAKRYAELAGIPAHKRTVRVLKHTIAMQSIHLAGVENVRQYLGHKSLASTGAYLKVGDAEASAAIAGALRD